MAYQLKVADVLTIRALVEGGWSYRRIARELGVPLHVDGARLWNAVVAERSTAVEMLHDADSATFCLSKGLSCPAGSVVVGDRAMSLCSWWETVP